MPTVSVDAFHVARVEFAQFADAGPDQRIPVLVDRAGWHTSPQVQAPPDIRFDYLPPDSPELQPAEHLWALSDAPLVKACFQNLDQLEALQAERCLWLQAQPDLVRSTANFHWSPQCA